MNKVSKYNFFLSILAVKDSNTGPEKAYIKAYNVISWPARPIEMLRSLAIVGKMPPTINSTNPTVSVENAKIKTL